MIEIFKMAAYKDQIEKSQMKMNQKTQLLQKLCFMYKRQSQRYKPLQVWYDAQAKNRAQQGLVQKQG